MIKKTLLIGALTFVFSGTTACMETSKNQEPISNPSTKNPSNLTTHSGPLAPILKLWKNYLAATEEFYRLMNKQEKTLKDIKSEQND